MRHASKWAAGITLALGMVWGGLAQADEGAEAQAKAKPAGKPDRAALMKRFDKNSDGKLDDEERKALREAMAERGGPARKPGAPGGFDREALLKKFDKDGDGKLSDAEREAARKERPGRPGAGGQRPDRDAILKRFDKDGDGQFSDEEKAAAREAFQKRRAEAKQ